MSALTCNCSILGGTTDSRPCPIHDAPENRRLRNDDDPATVRSMRHACYPFDPDPVPWVTPPVKS